jgi:hypothetical protein
MTEEVAKNKQAEAAAFKVAYAKSVKIKESGITPDMGIKEIAELSVKFAEAKAKKDDVEVTDDLISKQQFYIQQLIKFAALDTPEKRMDFEYADAFAKYSSDEERKELLSSVM